jgi:hypothetical protein
MLGPKKIDVEICDFLSRSRILALLPARHDSLRAGDNHRYTSIYQHCGEAKLRHQEVQSLSKKQDGAIVPRFRPDSA